ncbi:hypothetical protein HMPREF1143_0904 [Peptoanaerobacter stomatis]|uniref:Uncharacterized protein n=1 Tax=Peptoanaerobacter stomatis TaxID=796937 RepID=J5UER3_9FIRM|nr:hypothetical protein [Peptoanaerobacter stomatis]EJU21979.1 hypothetical protein HMPREF1143_0904 [Peptoanaerobacter stomatis]NWO24801.1 hypothetical protein [Peptostreptococcaceae bacterium oral taxon 081]
MEILEIIVDIIIEIFLNKVSDKKTVKRLLIFISVIIYAFIIIAILWVSLVFVKDLMPKCILIVIDSIIFINFTFEMKKLMFNEEN